MEKNKISINVTEKLYQEIEDYWHQNRLPNRSQAVRDLLNLGIEILKDKENKK